jgi:transcriptional regulator with XRE-family HTH domain
MVKLVPPANLRRLKAKAVEKDLRLSVIAKRLGFSDSHVSNVLRGRVINPRALKKITRVIESAPIPE